MFCEISLNECCKLFSSSYETGSHHNLILICCFFFSTMPEFHINGRFPYHKSSLENNAIGGRYDTSSSLMVTGGAYNSTTAISTTTNTMDTENSFCGIVFSIFCICLALAIIISIGMYLIRKRQKTKTQETQEFNESFQMKSLSLPNSMQP